MTVFVTRRELLDGLVKYLVCVQDSITSSGMHDECQKRDGSYYTAAKGHLDQVVNTMNTLLNRSTGADDEDLALVCRLAVDIEDFILVCSCSAAWKSPATRLDGLDDLYTGLLNRVELRQHATWTNLPARFHTDGIRHLVPAMAAGIRQSCASIGWRTASVSLAPMIKALDAVISHVAGAGANLVSGTDPMEPAVILLDLLRAGKLIAPPATNAFPQVIGLDGTKKFPAFANDPDAQSLIQECHNLLTRTYPTTTVSQFQTGWPATIWFQQLILGWQIEKVKPTANLSAYVQDALTNAKYFVKDSSWHTQWVDDAIALLASDPPTAHSHNYPPRSSTWLHRVYYTGDHVFRASQTVNAGEGGRFHLESTQAAGTTYFGEQAQTVICELFNKSTILGLSDIVQRSIASFQWKPRQKAAKRIIEFPSLDTRSAADKHNQPLEGLSWIEAQRLAREAYSCTDPWYGIRYPSTQSRESNVAFFHCGPQFDKTIFGEFTLKKAGRLVFSEDFWKYIDLRLMEAGRKYSVCFTRFPDDIRLK